MLEKSCYIKHCASNATAIEHACSSVTARWWGLLNICWGMTAKVGQLLCDSCVELQLRTFLSRIVKQASFQLIVVPQKRFYFHPILAQSILWFIGIYTILARCCFRFGRVHTSPGLFFTAWCDWTRRKFLQLEESTAPPVWKTAPD